MGAPSECPARRHTRAVTKDQHQAEAQLEQVKIHKQALGTSRGIETMFRSAYRVQMDLTSLADNKANMMISINGIIISIIIAAVAPKLYANPWLFVPSHAVERITAWDGKIIQVLHQTYEDEDAWETMLAGQLRFLLDVIDEVTHFCRSNSNILPHKRA